MQRTLCAAAAALALVLPSFDAVARPHTWWQIKCAGPYCWPVAVPPPKKVTRHHSTKRAVARRTTFDVEGHERGARVPAPRREEGWGLARRSAAKAGEGRPDHQWGRATAPIAIARRYLGANPT